jgi:AraC-like DNA-binding protein
MRCHHDFVYVYALGTYRDLLRSDWTHAVMTQVQVAAKASLSSEENASQIVARLALRIPPPVAPIEQLVGVALLQRVGWEILRRQVNLGALDHVEAFRDFERIVRATEKSPWTSILLTLEASDARVMGTAVRIRAFLDRHTSAKISITGVARDVGCSVRTATASFRLRYGLTIHDYLTRRRLARAVTLLTTTDMKLAAVAAAVGFTEKTTLHRQFVKLLGITPKRLRSAPTYAPTLIDRMGLPAEEADRDREELFSNRKRGHSGTAQTTRSKVDRPGNHDRVT